jgi:hypothetical protein
MSTSLIIDMRCLQDPNYAERGIGNHARCIIASAPAPFSAIIDPQLPPLPKSLAALAAQTVPHAYIPDIPPGAIFLNPSPMSPDQIHHADPDQPWHHQGRLCLRLHPLRRPGKLPRPSDQPP